MGCGRAGTRHAAAIAAAGCRVVAVHDVDARAATSLSLSVSAPARSLSELLEDSAIDVVAICTPPDSHATLGLQVLAAGKAVVVEKPPALSREAIADLEAASEKYGQPLAVMFQHRGRIPDEALRRTWSAKASAVVDVFRHRPTVHYTSHAWRADRRRSGGGFFAHLAIHYTDLACQVLGEPEHVQAVVDEGPIPGIDVRAALSVRMVGGALLTIHASSLPKTGQERLYLLDGTRCLMVTNNETRYAENGREIVLPAPPTIDLRVSVYREVCAALRSGRPVRRFRVGTAAGSVGVLEHVIDAMAAPIPRTR